MSRRDRDGLGPHRLLCTVALLCATCGRECFRAELVELADGRQLVVWSARPDPASAAHSYKTIRLRDDQPMDIHDTLTRDCRCGSSHRLRTDRAGRLVRDLQAADPTRRRHELRLGIDL